MPFPECGAMSQGYIGYHLQQAIQRELARRGIDKECASVVTQMVVSEDDPAFQKPTKPVGSFYSKEDADKIVAEKGLHLCGGRRPRLAPCGAQPPAHAHCGTESGRTAGCGW